MSIAQRSMRISNLRNRFFMLYLWTPSLARSTATKRIKKGEGKESHLFWHILFPITDYFFQQKWKHTFFPSIVAWRDNRHYLHCKRATRRGKRRTSKLQSTQRDKLRSRSEACIAASEQKQRERRPRRVIIYSSEKTCTCWLRLNTMTSVDKNNTLPLRIFGDKR